MEQSLVIDNGYRPSLKLPFESGYGLRKRLDKLHFQSQLGLPCYVRQGKIGAFWVTAANTHEEIGLLLRAKDVGRRDDPHYSDHYFGIVSADDAEVFAKEEQALIASSIAEYRAETIAIAIDGLFSFLYHDGAFSSSLY